MGQAADSHDVFFSYHGPDREAVTAVAHALRKERIRVFLDQWYLVPGRLWPQELERIIGSCRSMAIFVGPNGLGPWQQREKALALSRHAHQPEFPIIVVLLPSAESPPGFCRSSPGWTCGNSWTIRSP